MSPGLLLAASALVDLASTSAPNVLARLSTEARPSRGCGDLLGQMHRKPSAAIYVGCRYLPDRQGKPLRAIYRVSGRDAASVEAYLVKTVGLNRLRRSCCQWDSPPRQMTDPNGRDMSISMVSEGTSVATRADWLKISRFEIVEEILTKDV